ncbi:SipW-dependent-type signal peptide-containing protein [Haloglomus salinum]|uniref:SipW-dependent-type signal peptide-containing protein n=1 Tax=Haloglomus salinum TaxID=2962673 RepID=UPI0020C9D2A1|nr:SipW-dependent-type signal peptide-containing protein [Haloglomus salinum]
MSNNDDIGNDSQLYNLSRRKVLAGMGAVGLASAGAGLGTSALFSDTEEFTGNSITAGTLDMSVTGTIVAANDYWADQTGVLGQSDVADGAAVTFAVDDVKPGDWMIVCFDIENQTNPGYVQVSVPGGVTNEGGPNPEPEQEAEGDADNDADLGDAMLASLWQSYSGPTDGSPGGSKADLSGLDGWTNDEGGVFVPDPYAEVEQDDFTASDYGQTVQSDMDYPTVNEFGSFLSSGQVLRDNDGNLLQVGYDDETGEPVVGAGMVSFCLLLEIPAAVGNEIQGDSITFDLVFDTEQVRNNPDPFTTSTPTPTPTSTN